MPPPVAPPPARTLHALLRQYGVGELIACEPLPEGLLNRGYHLATTRGRYFLKHHLGGPDNPCPRHGPTAEGPLVRQHRATAALGALGLPVAPPLADRDGHTLAVHGGRRYALHPWVEGRHRGGGELRRPDCHRLGALLGLVHRALEQVIPAAQEDGEDGAGIGYGGYGGESRKHHGGRAAEPSDTHALIDRLLTRVRNRPRREAFDDLAEHRLLERRVLLCRNEEHRPLSGQTPAAGWVHGDFHPLNLLYRTDEPSEPVAIVDWDRLGVQPRAEEAVRAAAIFFLRPDGVLDLPKVRAYARAYRRAAGATGAELAAAVHRLWWERLNDFWMLRWHYERDDHRADPQFPAASALVGWWTRHAPAVRDAFCD